MTLDELRAKAADTFLFNTMDVDPVTVVHLIDSHKALHDAADAIDHQWDRYIEWDGPIEDVIAAVEQIRAAIPAAEALTRGDTP